MIRNWLVPENPLVNIVICLDKSLYKYMSGSVGNPESYWVYRRSPKPKFQIPGLFLVELSLVSACSPMFGWILLRKRRALWRGVRDTGWRRMTAHKAGYSGSRPGAGAGAVERPSSSFSEPEPGLEPGHGQCCLHTFGDGKKCNIRPQWKDKSTKKWWNSCWKIRNIL